MASVHPRLAPGIEAASQLHTSSQARLEELRQPVAGLNPMTFSFGVACGRGPSVLCRHQSSYQLSLMIYLRPSSLHSLLSIHLIRTLIP